MKANTNNTIAVNYREALAMIEEGKINCIGSNIHQINNQGQYLYNQETNTLHKWANNRYHLIAK